jgi:cation diffusion facilitator CzcD-associated flavoprotein CzcO
MYIPRYFLYTLIIVSVIKLCVYIVKQYIRANANKWKVNQKQVIVIGAGISGIAAAYYLQKKRISYIILEQALDLGGTWRDLKFHGSRVDTENVEYCYSFNVILDEKNTNWSRIEVMNYLRSTANKLNIFSHIKFNKSVNKINFDSLKKKWFVSTSDGSTYCADFLYNCTGFSNTIPYIPEFNNKDDFQGEIIHSVNLDESQTFYDKKVVIVGSGATVISTVPSLVKVCKSLTIIQRSPSYIYETACEPDLIWRLVIKLEKLGFHPIIKNIYQLYRMIDDEIIFAILRKFQPLAKRFFRMQWEDVADKEFIDTHLTPRYNVLEQRITVATGLKELIRTKAIEFETGEILHFTKNAIVMKSQKIIPCDICILATGFDINFFRFPIEIDGTPVDTKQLNWYKGLMLGNIPNYFQAVGCFDCSWTQRIESAYNLSVQIIEYMSNKSLNTVKVPKRTDVKHTVVFTPNYFLRKKDDLPIIYSLTANPTYDYFFSFHFKYCKELIFSE